MNILSKNHPSSRYRKENGITTIDLKLPNANHLFDLRDPAPFREKDLDEDAVDYIVSATSEFKIKTPLKLALHFSDLPELGPPENIVCNSIHDYFKYEFNLVSIKLTRVFRRGHVALIFGLCFLILCLFLSKFIILGEAHMAKTILSEGVTILGWVAMWKPCEIFLYSWWPLIEQRAIYKKLSKIDIDIYYS